jgi:hypothetical protein
MHMSNVTRVRLPSGEEKLVPSPELEKFLAERLEQEGPFIRAALRKCRVKASMRWPLRMVNRPEE